MTRRTVSILHQLAAIIYCLVAVVCYRYVLLVILFGALAVAHFAVFSTLDEGVADVGRAADITRGIVIASVLVFVALLGGAGWIPVLSFYLLPFIAAELFLAWAVKRLAERVAEAASGEQVSISPPH
ncbi:MAG TPA: hypothetical protein VJ867_06905 [Gemmatimonadaceae bacterium]|nr:hypothetical protein [Gemmatimonadaceae bacterium]